MSGVALTAAHSDPKLTVSRHGTHLNRYKIEQELGTEIKPIPPVIEKGLYCA